MASPPNRLGQLTLAAYTWPPPPPSCWLFSRHGDQCQVVERRGLLHLDPPAAEELQDSQKRRDDLVDGLTGQLLKGDPVVAAQRVENPRAPLVHARSRKTGQIDLRRSRLSGKAPPHGQERLGGDRRQRRGAV